MIIDSTITSKKSINHFNTLEEKFNAVHDSKYSYDKSVFKGNKVKIEITCPIHGSFWQRPNCHSSGVGCPKCAIKKNADNNRMAKEQFIEKANTHYSEYDYDYTDTKFSDTTTSADRVEVLCPSHGVFKTTINNHVQGKAKCPECSKEQMLGSLWSYSDWEDAGKTSKNFDGFKVYVLECWSDEGEHFLKVGKTYTKVAARFSNKYHMPYEYKVLKTVEGSSRFISELEASIKKQYKEHMYTPNIHFPGKYECIDISKKDTILKEL